MLGSFVKEDGNIYIKGRSVKNKPCEPLFIRIGNAKKKYLRTLLKSYHLCGYDGYDVEELASLSLRQWRYKKYPVPKGYELKHGHSFDPKKLPLQNWNFRKKAY